MRIDFDGFYVNISEHAVHIHDSYKIIEDEKKYEILGQILAVCPEAFGSRSIRSIIREWKAHNILYKWNIRREETAHVDFELDQKFIYKLGYFFICLVGRE